LASKPSSHSSNFVHDIERLDQHFLDPATADHIVGYATISPDDVILDIGAGTGILTSAILKTTSARVVAIEPDRRCRPYLERLQQDHPNLAIKLNRIQNMACSEIATTTLIIANPPFSALEYLTGLLRELPILRQAIMCVSRRWADAASAKIDGPEYGVPSVAIQSRFTARTTGLINGSTFTPPIRQPAALVEISRRPMPDAALDLLADSALNQAGSRLKDFLRSRRLRQTLNGRYHALLRDESLRRLQQRRFNELTNDQISKLARALK
jgi:16S rRNA A1518/A1519 N6-dimethyltransferase RsmA/KsgA/DIM1 with predicted DNA glycosylase/AP lyase activity